MLEIKYWEPVGVAWNRMKDVLFRPFNFEKWMVMGFAAWFAGLNTGGGSGSSSWGNHQEPSDVSQSLQQFWAEYSTVVLAVGGGVLIVILILGILFSWIGARGKFIFLDNVIHNRAAIVEPWKKYRIQGNSLFLWNLALSCIALILFLLILVICLPMAWPLFTNHSNILMGISGMVLGGCLLLIYVLCFSYLGVFVYDFVVPLMLKHNIGIRAAWTRFSVILKPQFGKFILYGLVRYALNLGVGMAMMAAFLLTCCCLLLVASIPYIGTVLLLPVFVLYRFIGLEFLRQFGEEFSLLQPQEEPNRTELAEPME